MQPTMSPVLSRGASRSFNSYSNSSLLADIAARVVEEYRAENENGSEFFGVGDGDDLFCSLENDINGGESSGKGDDEEEEEEFEFAFVPRDAELSLISADQIFYNGQIRPVFNRNLNLLIGDDVESGNSMPSSSNSLLTSSSSGEQQKVSAPPRTLRKLLSEDRETPTPSSSCSSSSEADELEGIPEGTYCVWRPKEEASPEKCKKSNSTGSSSKRWRLRDLVYRSKSDGKDTFVFRKGEDNKKVATPTPAATKNRGDKRRSYLPYGQDFRWFNVD